MFEFITNNTSAIILWLGAICTFAIYSILYKENPYYRLFEHIFIGLASGQGIYVSWTQVLRVKWWGPMMSGQWWWIFALVAGLMWYFIYSQRYVWISRLIIGFFMGFSAGGIFQSFATIYIEQIYRSFKPVFGTGLEWGAAVNNFMFIAVLLAVMAYFFFSIDHKSGAMRRSASTGRWLLMFAFGAMFGSTVMARMSLFIGRARFLIRDWAPIVPDWFWWSLAAVTIIGMLIFIESRKNRKKYREESF